MITEKEKTDTMEFIKKYLLPEILEELKTRSKQIDKWYKPFEDMILREQKQKEEEKNG